MKAGRVALVALAGYFVWSLATDPEGTGHNAGRFLGAVGGGATATVEHVGAMLDGMDASTSSTTTP